MDKKPEDYRKAAQTSLDLAKTLATGEPLSPREFLECMAVSDQAADHDGATCGLCHHLILGAQIAREMLAQERYGSEVMTEWAQENERRWQESKFFKLYEEESSAGRDPEKAFKERGWEM